MVVEVKKNLLLFKLALPILWYPHELPPRQQFGDILLLDIHFDDDFYHIVNDEEAENSNDYCIM